jgi:hypothetical protein
VTDVGDLRDIGEAKRWTLLASLIHECRTSARDEVATMFCKRMAVIHKKGKERLAELHEAHRAESERLLDVFGDVLAGAREATAAAESGAAAAEPAAVVAERAGRLLLKTLADAGGIEQLSAAHEVVSAHHGNNYLPLLEKFYKSHRSALFTLLDTLDLEATSADHSVLDAVVPARDPGPHRRVRPGEGDPRARGRRGDGGDRHRLRHRGVAQDPGGEGPAGQAGAPPP